ncbi:glycerophosphodiester phosphodiesterase family protein [Streptomonospora wellingtoniae]|uniref:glycerophosphodiester phosphodiesterase n=1 Tax=Streptomonospora wellingtoniae TaxID=3075544 RepID=A0ABU2KY83_9ACTN|nr:glycerophosphodiester phosphodiesterase family protein [Streptomonospora sp. DSM 45055]MDT0304166.1 glycerophosphodiester phosphodiesterase family protein [Streptomonospora sp. DSM 45055]
MRRNKQEPELKIISHRGASGHRPEHTLGSYELGARVGGDFMEIDLVATADGVLVARHEPEIGGTTDVADHPEFADRRTTRTVDGRDHTGWFAHDFTLDELKTLRATERIPEVRPGNAAHDGVYEIPTLQEIVDLARRMSEQLGRRIGIYPETKHPDYHSGLGLDLEPPLLAALLDNGLAGPEPELPVFLQSFESQSLRKLADVQLPRVLLMGTEEHWRPLLTPEGLSGVAEYAEAIGPHKDLVIPRGGDGELGEATPLVADAHEAGLLVHPWTFRSENRFLPADLRSGGDAGDFGGFAAEYGAFFEAGVDGVFTDHSRHALLAREIYLESE